MNDLNGINLGLSGSSFNAKAIIDKTMEKRQKLIDPSKNRLEKIQVKLEAWDQAKALIEEVRTAADPLVPISAWNKKNVTVSNEDVLTAKVTSTAEPGTYYVNVDQIALAHIVGSQTYEKEDAYIGTGEIQIRVDDGDYKSITIDESQNTIKGLVDAINNAGIDVKAQIIKTDHGDNKFRVVLTSLMQGEKGYLNVRTDFASEFAPEFDNYHTNPSDWKFAPQEPSEETANDTGASNSVPTFSGKYRGDEDLKIRFTATNTGKVAGDNSLTLRWQDSKGREGILDLGKFAYSPGKPIEVVDGIFVSFSSGDIVINDSFEVAVKPDETGSWWLSDKEEAAKIYKPTVWSRQYNAGKPIVTGTFTGDDDDEYTLKVVKGGVIGTTEQVIIRYESENGFSGEINVGQGYKPGDKIALDQGLELSLEKGVLQEGFESKFEAEEGVSSNYWWLFPDNEEEDLPGKISKTLNWYGSEGDQVNLSPRDLIDPETGKSNAEKKISGNYIAMENKIYTFTVEGNGTVGTTEGIYLKWEDDKGNEGTLPVGSRYSPGSPLPFDSGLNVILENGQIFNGDLFTVDAYSATIQPAQDALIRLGKDAGDGGLQIRNNTNEFKEILKGVNITAHQESDAAVVLTITENREEIKEKVKTLIEKYNEALKYFIEALKYDVSTKIAGPLQADSVLAGIQREFADMIITPILGLPKGKNTLSVAGISIDKTGLVQLNEQEFDQIFTNDYETAANLFRNFGKSDNSGIIFINAGINTKPSREEGYQIDITQAATNGYYKSPVIQGDIIVDSSNKNIKVVIDGRESGIIEMAQGNYSLNQFSRDLEKQLKEDDNVGSMDFTVQADENRLLIRSNKYGSSSKAKIEGVGYNLLTTELAVLDGESMDGKNVEGIIDNVKMEGQGRVLRGEKDSDFDGLRLYSYLTESQVEEGNEGMIRITKGVAQRIKGYLDEVLKLNTGPVANSEQGIKNQIENINDTIKRFDERTKVKKDNMMMEFSRMEGKISELKSQQKYLRGQFPQG